MPIRTVAVPIINSETTSVLRRPTLSPIPPKSTLPNGLARNPTAKVAKEARVPASGLYDGKNRGPNTRAAAVPYRKKS